MSRLISTFPALLTLVLAIDAQAGSGGAPLTLSQSGYLLDSADAPISGANALTFRVMDALTGGTTQWEGACATVAVDRGYYTVILGSSACVGSSAGGLDPTLDTSDLP